MKVCRGKRIFVGVILLSLSLGILTGCGEKKGASIFVGDMDCEYAGSTLELNEEKLQFIYTYDPPKYTTIDVTSGVHKFTRFGFSPFTYEITSWIDTIMYPTSCTDHEEELELQFHYDGTVEVKLLHFIMLSEDDFSGVGYEEMEYDIDQFLCKSEFVKKIDALNKVEPLVIVDREARNVVENIKDGELLNVIYVAAVSTDILYLDYDAKKKETTITLKSKGEEWTVVTDVEIVYDIEESFYVEDEENIYTMKLLVTEDEIKVGIQEKIFVFDEADVKKKTIIQNW